jgi:hypothetical protein
MGKVPAYPLTFDEAVKRCPGGTRLLVVEGNAGVDKIADGLHARPTGWRVAESLPRHVPQALGIAIAAAEEIDEDLYGQVVDVVLARRRSDNVGKAGILDQELAVERDVALRCEQSQTPVSETIAVGFGRDIRSDLNRVARQKVRHSRRMDIEKKNERCRRRASQSDGETGSDSHGGFPFLDAEA